MVTHWVGELQPPSGPHTTLWYTLPRGIMMLPTGTLRVATARHVFTCSLTIEYIVRTLATFNVGDAMMDQTLDGITVDVAWSVKSDHWPSRTINTTFDFTGVTLRDTLIHGALAGSSFRVKSQTVARTYKNVDDMARVMKNVSIASLIAGTLKADVDKIVDTMSTDKKRELFARLEKELKTE